MALSLFYHKIIAMEVRPLRTEEGLVYRQLRLSALSDAPDAFGDTLSDALVRPQQWWIDRVHEISRNSDREVIFVAFDHHEPCGLLYVDRLAQCCEQQQSVRAVGLVSNDRTYGEPSLSSIPVSERSKAA
jgi:hypothetical protein